MSTLKEQQRAMFHPVWSNALTCVLQRQRRVPAARVRRRRGDAGRPGRWSEKGEVLLRGVGTLRYLFHQVHLCNVSLMV